jgi:hypothetical protein
MATLGMAAFRPDFDLPCGAFTRVPLPVSFDSAPATSPGSRGRTSSAVGVRAIGVQPASATQAGRGRSLSEGALSECGTTFTTTIKEST